MKTLSRCLLGLLAAALLASAAYATTPVQIVTARGTGTSLPIAFTAANVTAGDTLVLEVYTQSAAPTSVTESLAETVNTRVAWGGGGSSEFSVYDVLNSAGNAKVSFTINVSASQNITAILEEYAGAAAHTFDQATAIATNTSTSVSSGSLTPAESGELAIGALVIAAGSDQVSAWGGGFVEEANQNSSGGVAPTINLADQILSSASPIAVTATLSGSYQWSVAELLYKPAASSCTHAGITSAGAISVPNGASGSYRLANGSFGTPDCSTVSYFHSDGSLPGVN